MVGTLGMSLSSIFLDPRAIQQNLPWGAFGRIWHPWKVMLKKPLRLSEMMPRIRKSTLLCLEMDLNLLYFACGVASRHFYCGMQTVLLKVKEIYKEAYN